MFSPLSICVLPSISKIGSPHQFLLEVLYEGMLTLAYDKLSVTGFLHGNMCHVVAAFIASVNGNEEIVATAVHLYVDDRVVVDDYRSCAEAVWSNWGQNQHVCVGGYYRASYTE